MKMAANVRLTACRREGEHRRFTHCLEQTTDMSSEKYVTNTDQDRPQNEQSQIERADQLPVGVHHVKTPQRYRRSNGPEHAEWCGAHDVVCQAQHHRHHAIKRLNDDADTRVAL